MKIPKSDTLADKIAVYLSKFKERRYTDIVVSMECKGYTDDRVRKILRQMRDEGQVLHEENSYSLPYALREHYNGIGIGLNPQESGQIVAPRSIPEFRPIQPKNQFWNAYRREPIREISFKTAGAPALSFVQPV